MQGVQADVAAAIANEKKTEKDEYDECSVPGWCQTGPSNRFLTGGLKLLSHQTRTINACQTVFAAIRRFKSEATGCIYSTRVTHKKSESKT